MAREPDTVASSWPFSMYCFDCAHFIYSDGDMEKKADNQKIFMDNHVPEECSGIGMSSTFL